MLKDLLNQVSLAQREVMETLLLTQSLGSRALEVEEEVVGR